MERHRTPIGPSHARRWRRDPFAPVPSGRRGDDRTDAPREPERHEDEAPGTERPPSSG